MSKKKKYEKEFKEMIVDLLEAGHTARKVSEDYGLYEGMIRRWKRESRLHKGIFSIKGKSSLTPEEREIRELKKQLKEAQLERDILKKAGAAPQSASSPTIPLGGETGKVRVHSKELYGFSCWEDV